MSTIYVHGPANLVTYRADGPASRFADWLARAILKLQSYGHLLRMSAPGVPEASAQLLRMADAYEATQPSYAADLRAAASMASCSNR